MQAFFVVFFVYMAMYLIRNNFKAAQPFLKEEIGLSTLELGYIGLAFSITYGLGKHYLDILSMDVTQNVLSRSYLSYLRLQF